MIACVSASASECPSSPSHAGNLHPAEHQPAARREAMRVDPDPGPQRFRRDAEQALSDQQIISGRDLEIAEPGREDDDRLAKPLDQRAIVGGRDTRRERCGVGAREQLAPKHLWCCDRAQLRARRRLDDQLVRVNALDRVDHRRAGHRCPCRSSRLHAGRKVLRDDQRARAVVDRDDFDVRQRRQADCD